MIVRSSPASSADLDHAEQAWFDSDAAANDEAIREIDAEAAKHGLVRTREYWLQRFALTDGKIVHRGFCFRAQPSGLADRVAARRGGGDSGLTSAEIVRQMRDSE